jgi:uncharacterized protein (TIGR00255 family)
MTGFASAEQELVGSSLVFEIRSVNSRFLDLTFRLSDELRSAEPGLRELIAARASRGKVEVRLYFNRGDRLQALSVNTEALEALARAAQDVRAVIPDAQPFRVSEILHWPGVTQEKSLTPEALREAALALASRGLADFAAARQREGHALSDAILARVQAMEEIVLRLAPIVPQLVAQQSQKLTEKLRELLQNAVPDGFARISGEELTERIRQESTLYGLRIDVAEELTRLSAHLKEVRGVLGKGGQVGKRLDFLMQELNREANTLGSKAGSVELSQAAVELKLLIEQMREQVQNLE